PSEVSPIIKMGKKLVAARTLPVGHVLTTEDILLKSPGDGIPPYELDNVIGKRLLQPLIEDETITAEALGKKAD
ncbi:MAG: SAF domain-containing protein, partial [Acidobacteria bacterium]|nr:SAF domain-containing protein [Acidobacteriota bacterium]